MMIEVLGTGCATCNKLESRVRAVAEELGVPFQIEHVYDINAIVQRGVIAPPALAIDGKVVVAGRVPSEAELTALISSARTER